MVKQSQRHNERLAAHMGEVARRARVRQELTQAEVAQSIGTVTAVYGRLERGGMLPSVSTLRRLCLTLGESANTLLGLSELTQPAWVAYALEEGADPAQMKRLLRMAQRMNEAQLAILVEMARVLLRHTEGGDAGLDTSKD